MTRTLSETGSGVKADAREEGIAPGHTRISHQPNYRLALYEAVSDRPRGVSLGCHSDPPRTTEARRSATRPKAPFLQVSRDQPRSPPVSENRGVGSSTLPLAIHWNTCKSARRNRSQFQGFARCRGKALLPHLVAWKTWSSESVAPYSDLDGSLRVMRARTSVSMVDA